MFKTTLLAAVAIIAIAAPAKASTIDVLLGSPSSSFSYDSTGGLNPNIDLTGVTNLSLNNAAVISGNTSIPNFAAPPSGPLLNNLYLAVFGNGVATFSLASNGNTFGLTWGSIDSYNSLVLTDSSNNTYTITGAQILNELASVAPGATQANVVVDDPFGRIVTAELTSSANSFEAANFQGSTVPLPASALMFAMALAGLALVSHRRSQNKA